jgi:hypothetical protein
VPSGTPALWPAPVTVDGCTYTRPGDSGYASDASLAAALNQATTVPYIAYLGINDAGSVNFGNNRLNFEGYSTPVPYSAANVGSGAYTFWGDEHLLYLPTLSGTALLIAQQLERFVASNASVSGVPIFSKMVHREGDGTPIKPGYAPPNSP